MPSSPGPASQETLKRQLSDLGVRRGDWLMVHASLKAIGPVADGPSGVVRALAETVGDSGLIMGYGSWDRSPYEQTLNGRRMSRQERDNWPVFDPATAEVYPGFGRLNAFILARPGALRSHHPDASMVGFGAPAAGVMSPHRLGEAFDRGSPLERFVQGGGRILTLGAGPDSLTILHYAEAIADIPGKRRVTYEMPVRRAGATVWAVAHEYDSNGILDQYAGEGPDAVECITRDYLTLGRHREGLFGAAVARLFEGADLVAFGVEWLERRHGAGDAMPTR
ncbi:aminoglycoside 3-N-acetyltransferase [Brevundimonas diminuta]|uniref:Aminoglycoside N(3)-acetyltransferase n=1 Tax=Brevundimonas diminuta TaxID=293 RepID=A0A1Z3LVK0_BREDI|nr:aminoglycoside 3-N-acetyltransferase [Brevundimonas diminuta]ASD26213.1 aminoglycoside 3-N-acetyltransferase [Brevundimonas diminuta]